MTKPAARPTKPNRPLNGNHHITGITADVKTNVDFWSRIMGLRFVKKTLNFETTFRYHTYFGNTDGDVGSVVTFLEFNEFPRAVPGKGNHHAAVLRVKSHAALDFWMDRLTTEQVYSELIRLDPTQPRRLVFRDPEGHNVELIATDAQDPPQAFPASDIPDDFRITGIEGIRTNASLDEIAPYAEHLGFTRNDRLGRFELQGTTRSSRWYSNPAPNPLPFQEIAVGVWHHLALDAEEDLQGWRDYSNDGPLRTTPVYDHHVFDSCYTNTPAIIELTSAGPGFLVDQTKEELGERLALSKRVEPLRAKLERELTPIVNPRRADGTLITQPKPGPAKG